MLPALASASSRKGRRIVVTRNALPHSGDMPATFGSMQSGVDNFSKDNKNN